MSMMNKIFTLALCAMLSSFVALPTLAAGGGGSGGGGAIDMPYMELDPLILPVITEEGITQQVSLIVKIEVSDSSMLDQVKAMEPRIVDAFVQDLYGTLSKENAMVVHGIVNIPLVKARLKHTAIEVAGEELIHDVLLQVVQQHRV